MTGAGERACEGSRVSADCGSTISGKRLENHEQFVAQIVCIFHLSSSALQAIATQIAGKRLITAQRELLELAGVAGVYIKTAHQDDISLPADPDQIQMNVSS